MLAEVEDPRFFRGDVAAFGDPVERLKLYRNHDAQMLDLRYTLPALEAGFDRVPNLRLIAFPVDADTPVPKWVDAEVLRSWFAAYVEGCGGEPVWSPTVLRELIPELGSSEPIPVVPLPEYESSPREPGGDELVDLRVLGPLQVIDGARAVEVRGDRVRALLGRAPAEAGRGGVGRCAAGGAVG